MCGRMTLTLPHDAMVNMFDATIGAALMPTPQYNICPTQNITVAVSYAGERVLTPMRWGFIPHWYKSPTDGPLLINARAETIAEKPAFREACRQRRCLVPASGYFEWTIGAGGNRLPWYISRVDKAAIALAGIWQDWTDESGREIATVSVVTTAANAQLGEIHDRMPVSIESADYGLWLGEEGKGASTLMRAPESDVFTYHRVSPAVNSNRAEGPELILPYDD